MKPMLVKRFGALLMGIATSDLPKEKQISTKKLRWMEEFSPEEKSKGKPTDK